MRLVSNYASSIQLRRKTSQTTFEPTLSSPDPPVSERDLAVELAIRFLDRPAADITAEQRRQQRIQLHHHQLPKLADYGLIVYDQPTQTVSITAEGYEALSAYTDTQQQPPAAAFISSD